MRPTGTEPGDFVEFDMDLIEADRRQRLRQALDEVMPTLERELGITLAISNLGNDLALADENGVRFTATIAPDGRVMVTDQRENPLI